MRKLALTLLVPALLAAGCSKSKSAEQAEGAAKPADKADLPPLPEPNVAPVPGEDEAAGKPMMKETTATSADELGTLPDGVGLETGSALPDLTLDTIDGNAIRLSSLTEKAPALFIFYRGGWCPYCNFQVQTMTRAYDLFRAKNVTPVMISVDSPDEAAKTAATYEIPFPVLSDSELVAHKAFNVAFTVDDETLAKYQTYGIDLEKASGKDHHTLAVPSVFLVGTDNKIIWAHADADYKTRPTPDQLLAAIDAALAK